MCRRRCSFVPYGSGCKGGSWLEENRVSRKRISQHNAVSILLHTWRHVNHHPVNNISLCNINAILKLKREKAGGEILREFRWAAESCFVLRLGGGMVARGVRG